MTSLNIIEQFLNIQIGNKRLMNGKKKKNKNKYYFFANRYYIVSLPNGKWFILSTNDQTRELLTKYSWRYHEDGYAQTDTDDHKSTTTIHRKLMNPANDMVVDHINTKPFDNRINNLRITTIPINNRNKKLRHANISGVNGVSKIKQGRYEYWKAVINTDANEQIQKSFSIAKLGDVEAKRQAIEQRLAWKIELNYRGE